MNFGSIGEKFIFAAAVIGFIVLFTLMRGRDPKKARAEIVRTLAMEIKINTVLVDTFDLQPKPRRFEVTGWKMNRKKINFLDKNLQKDLADVFESALDFNSRLKAAKKSHASEKVPLNVESIKPALPRIKNGLEDWLLANVGRIDQQERPGMLDGLFGR